jgi:hypothetical protein
MLLPLATIPGCTLLLPACATIPSRTLLVALHLPSHTLLLPACRTIPLRALLLVMRHSRCSLGALLPRVHLLLCPLSISRCSSSLLHDVHCTIFSLHALTLAPSPTGEIAPPPTSVLIATSSTLGTSPLASSPSGLVHISRGSTLSTSCNVPSPPEGISNSDTVKRWRFAKLAKRQSHFLLSAFVKFFGMVQIIFCGGSFDVECFYDTMYVIMVKRSEKRGKKRRLCQKSSERLHKSTKPKQLFPLNLSGKKNINGNPEQKSQIYIHQGCVTAP